MSLLGGDVDTLGAAAPVLASRVNGFECFFHFLFFSLLSFLISALSRRGQGGVRGGVVVAY